MRTTIIIFLALLFLCSFNSLVAAQDKDSARKAIYLGIGGAGLSLINLNYDHSIAKKWQGRIGAGFIFDFSENAILSRITEEKVRNRSYGITLPLTASYLLGKGKKFLELGGGITPLYFSEKNDVSNRLNKFFLLPAAFVGYRRHPLQKGFVFRVNLNASYFKQKIYFGLGLSFGLVP